MGVCTLSQLKTLREYWIDFHGPANLRNCLRAYCQLELLDAFSQNDSLLENYRSIYKEWRSERKAIENLKSSEQLDDDTLRFLNREITKMEQLDLSEAAISELESNFTKISQSRITIDASDVRRYCIRRNRAYGSLKCFKHQMNNLSSIDPSMEELSKRANSFKLKPMTLSQEIQALSGGFDFDREMIESTISEMTTWQELKRKYEAV